MNFDIVRLNSSLEHFNFLSNSLIRIWSFYLIDFWKIFSFVYLNKAISVVIAGHGDGYILIRHVNTCDVIRTNYNLSILRNTYIIRVHKIFSTYIRVRFSFFSIQFFDCDKSFMILGVTVFIQTLCVVSFDKLDLRKVVDGVADITVPVNLLVIGLSK